MEPGTAHGPALQLYIHNLMREMIGAPHILNPFNPGTDGTDLRQYLKPPEAKLTPESNKGDLR